MGELEAGFAKLQGEDFEYYMQTYSIILGRNSKKSSVDVDLASIGGGMNISRQHARIYYDFDRKRFALEVLSKNGCYVEGVLYLRGTAHVKLDSQDLLQIGEKKFYFLLPTKKISKPPPLLSVAPPLSSSKKRTINTGGPSIQKQKPEKEGKKRKSEPLALPPPPKWQEPGLSITSGGSSGGVFPHATPPYSSERRTESTGYTSSEEREVVAAVGSVLSELCGPGDWMPIAELYKELHIPEHYVSICSPAKVWKVVDIGANEADSARPWAGLLSLLRRYPEHFIINIKTKGRISAEYVSLVSLVS